MDSTTPAKSNMGTVARTVSKILRLRRKATCSVREDDVCDLKPSKPVEDFPSVYSGPLDYNNDKVDDTKKQTDTDSHNKEAMESLLANLFASISAIKASYAQIQVAQTPYDPDTIQSSDQAVVSELKHLSELKQLYLKHELSPHPPPPMEAQIQEHRNLIKTFQITAKKLESDIQIKDSDIHSLQSQLITLDRQNRSLESQLHPGHSLSCLDGLHLSGLDPTHFLAAVRYTFRSVKSFAKLMMNEMVSAGWDLNAAAASIQLDVQNKTNHLIFAFESFISQNILSGFGDRNFGLDIIFSHDHHQFFVQFNESKNMKLKQLRTSSPLGKFCRAKYMSLVNPKMEASFFGNLDQREVISSGRGFPDTEFFMGFAEMARRVWMLHCLFFSFGSETEASVFQMRRGCRFSDVYMESVLESDTSVKPTVGFTVVPGFKIGKMVIQSKVYILDGVISG